VRYPLLPVAIIGLVMGWAGSCLGHGAHGTRIEGAAGIEASYHGGGPMAFCDVRVYRPGDAEGAFHTGTTGPLGRFAFVPDTSGTWRVVVDDGMGHVAEIEVAVDAAMTETTLRGDPSNRMDGVIVGVSVIFGLFGLTALVRRRVKKAG